MKKISVIVPIYNVEPYLNQCIDSILAQTYENLEIILVNNGSTDGSGSICDTYEKQDSRVKVIHQENRFPVGARNSGILAATGDYIGYVDSDDWIEPTMYEKMIQILENDPEIDFVSMGFWEEYETAKYKGENGAVGRYLSSDEDYLSFLFVGGKEKVGPTMWNKLFRQHVAKKHHLLPAHIRRIEDNCCIFGCIPFISGYQVIDLPLYHYRRRAGSTVDIAPIPSSTILNDACDYFKKKCQKHPQNQYIQKQLETYYFDGMGRWLRQEGPFPRGENPYDYQKKRVYTDPFSPLLPPQSVVLYGFGEVGKSYYQQLQEQDCVKLIAIVDQGKVGQRVGEILISSPDSLADLEFDALVLCIYEKKQGDHIRKTLIEDFGIPKEKIAWAQPQKWRDLFLEEVNG